MPPIELVLEENEALKGKVNSLTEEVADLKAELSSPCRKLLSKS